MMSWIKRHWKTILIFGCLFILFFLNAFHEKYPDEFDSIVGGRYIDMGLIQYRDWFQHHQPGAYVMAAIILPFTGISFVKFRIGWAAVIFAINVCGYLMLRKRFPSKDLTFYLVMLFTIALAGTYFWWHMLLADSLSAYLFLPAFALLFMKDYYGGRFEVVDLVLVGVFSFLAWFTSMTTIYVVAAVSAYALWLFVSRRGAHDGGTTMPSVLTGSAILAGPYVLFAVWLVVTGSLKDWYFASIYYNSAYYIYNYPHAPGQMVNPIRYAVLIFSDFVNNYALALGGITGLPITNPGQTAFAFSSFAAMVLVTLTGRWTFLFPLLVTLVYSNSRSNPQSIRETDYQSALYVMTSMFNGLFTLSALKELIDSKKMQLSATIVASGMMLLLLMFWIATPFFYAQRMMQKYVDKYMGKAPLIYDRPEIAGYVNAIIGKEDTAWVGPFAFEELFYLKTTRIPSRYHWFLQFAQDTKIGPELIEDMMKDKPKVIVFQRNYTPWGGDAKTFNGFFQKFLDEHYFRLFTLNAELSDVKYVWKIGNTLNYDLDGDFNFDKRHQNEILEKLLTLGYIEAVPKHPAIVNK